MEDQQIIDLYWARNEQAICASQEKYGALCLGVSRNIVHSVEDAEECLNDTWIRAWNAMPPQRPHHLQAFFIKIIRNLSLTRWEREHAQKRGGGEIPVVLDELQECLGSGSAEDEVLARELGASINELLRALSPRSRYIFLRRYFYLDSIADIAEHCHLSVGAVTMDLSRSRQKLRRCLEEYT